MNYLLILEGKNGISPKLLISLTLLSPSLYESQDTHLQATAVADLEFFVWSAKYVCIYIKHFQKHSKIVSRFNGSSV